MVCLENYKNIEISKGGIMMKHIFKMKGEGDV